MNENQDEWIYITTPEHKKKYAPKLRTDEYLEWHQTLGSDGIFYPHVSYRRKRPLNNQRKEGDEKCNPATAECHADTTHQCAPLAPTQVSNAPPTESDNSGGAHAPLASFELDTHKWSYQDAVDIRSRWNLPDSDDPAIDIARWVFGLRENYYLAHKLLGECIVSQHESELADLKKNAALRKRVESMQKYLLELSLLGGGRSEGNSIAQHALKIDKALASDLIPKEVLPVPESTPYLTSPEISQKKVGATVSSAAGVEELIDAVCYLFGINNQADFVHSNIHSGQMEYAAKQHLAKLSRVEANLNEVAESSNKRIENLEAKLSASERKREELVKAVQANHKWHQENDEYDGYSDSELCEQNLKALAANAESEDSK